MPASSGNFGEQLSPHGNRVDTVQHGGITMNGMPLHPSAKSNAPDASTDGAKAVEGLKLAGIMNELIAQLPNTPAHATGELQNAISDCSSAIQALATCRTPRDVEMVAAREVARAMDAAGTAKQIAQGEKNFETAEHLAEFFIEKLPTMYGESAKAWSQEFAHKAQAFENYVEQQGFAAALDKFDYKRGNIGVAHAYMLKHDEDYKQTVDGIVKRMDGRDEAAENDKKVIDAIAGDDETIAKNRAEMARLQEEIEKLKTNGEQAEVQVRESQIRELQRQNAIISQQHATTELAQAEKSGDPAKIEAAKEKKAQADQVVTSTTSRVQAARDDLSNFYDKHIETLGELGAPKHIIEQARADKKADMAAANGMDSTVQIGRKTTTLELKAAKQIEDLKNPQLTGHTNDSTHYNRNENTVGSIDTANKANTKSAPIMAFTGSMDFRFAANSDTLTETSSPSKLSSTHKETIPDDVKKVAEKATPNKNKITGGENVESQEEGTQLASNATQQQASGKQV